MLFLLSLLLLLRSSIALLLLCITFSCGETGTTFTPVNGDEADSVNSRGLESPTFLLEVMRSSAEINPFVIVSFDLSTVFDERDSESASTFCGTSTNFFYFKEVFSESSDAYSEVNKLFVVCTLAFAD